MKNRALIVIMGVFCASLIFHTGYLVGLGKNRQKPQRLRPASLTGIVSRETEKARVITMNLSGMNKDGINIEIKGNYLIIEARQSKADSTNSFLQILSLPEGIKIPAITAEYNKGILTIIMPKDAKINKPTAEIIKIPVK